VKPSYKIHAMERNKHNQREDHREELKSRYSEPFSDSPYQYNQNDINQIENSRYGKMPSTGSGSNDSKYQSRQFPESGVNRDQRGLPGIGDSRPPIAGDDRIRDIISDRLNDDPKVDARDINVIVHHGQVTLAGTVDNDDSKSRAERLADSTPGIMRVDSRLRVRPGEEENEADRKIK
jgi:hypothetical protein